MSQKLTENIPNPEVRAASLGARSEVSSADLAGFDDRIRRALGAALEKKALDLTVLDLRGVATFTDFFVIATGTNRRQCQAISDEIVEQMKRSGTRAARVEGFPTAEWILIDYADFVVHIFEEKARRFYDLERLWREAKRIDVLPDQVGSEISNFKSEISNRRSESTDL